MPDIVAEALARRAVRRVRDCGICRAVARVSRDAIAFGDGALCNQSPDNDDSRDPFA